MRSPGSLLVLLGFPPFVYAAALLFSTLDATDVVVVVLAFLLVAAVGMYSFFVPGVGTWVAAAVYLIIGIVILWVAFAPAQLGALGFDLALGGLAAGPVVSLLSFCHPTEGPGTRIVGVQVALVDGLLLLATHVALAGSVSGTTAQGLVGGYFTAIGQQTAGIFDLLALQGTVSAPIGSVFDPWYVALAAFPVLAILLTFLAPTTGRGASLPTVDRDPEGADPADLEVAPSFRTLLASRSAPNVAPASRLPGVGPLVAAGGATVAYLAFAYLAPAFTIPITSVGVILGIVALVVVLRRPIGPGEERAEADAVDDARAGPALATPGRPDRTGP